MSTRNPNLKRQSSNIKREILVIRMISLWFALQVLLNIAITVYLTLYPPDEAATWFERLDLTVNTGINAALAIGFWRRAPWAWSTAVWLIPLYWALHAWHMFVPEEGLLLWPFLMVDAVIMGYLVAPKGRQAIGASPDRWVRLSLLPAPMFALGLYALLAPILGMFIALAAGVSVVIIGWRNSHSKIQISNSR